MKKKNGIFRKTAKVIFYPEILATRRVKENIEEIKNMRTFFVRKKGQYYSKETQNFDYWKENCNYTADNLESNYKSYCFMSYLFFLSVVGSIFLLIATDSHFQVISFTLLLTALWHRCVFRAKIIKDFSMYTEWYAPLKKADDIFPNPFEPIKEKFSLIYDEKDYSENEINESDFYEIEENNEK